MVNQISVEDALKGDYIILDVRAPIEFEEAHIPGAISLPLIDDEQRAIVGTLYKQVGSGEAYAKGFEFIMPKSKALFDELLKHDKPVVVYCWRGGLRSKIVTLLGMSGRKDIFQLIGGYKAYRDSVRKSLEDYDLKQKIIVLHGYSCVDKTKILNALPNSIDLEGLAGHRGSVFGAMGMKPNSQKMFDSLVLDELIKLKDESYIVLEGESAKIGNVNIPKFLFDGLKAGTNVLIKMGLEDRMKVFIDEYKIFDRKEEFIEILRRLSHRVGKKNVADIEMFLGEGNLVEACKILFEKYYDPLYDHTMNKLEYALEVERDYVVEIKKFLEKIKSSQ